MDFNAGFEGVMDTISSGDKIDAAGFDQRRIGKT
jgi:hypothetical protein